MNRLHVMTAAALLGPWFLGTAAAQSTFAEISDSAQPVVAETQAPPAQAPLVGPGTCGYTYCWQKHICLSKCAHYEPRLGLCDCPVVWLKPWTCDDLKMEPVEDKPCCHGCGPCGWLHGLLWCPPEEEEGGNGNGEKNNGEAKKPAEGEKKEGEEPKKENGNGEEEAEEPETLTPLMQIIQCCHPGLYDRMDCCGAKLYGWIQQGYTVNFEVPQNGINFGVNFNNRSNTYQLNQTYFVLENTLEIEDHFNWGYRVDFLAGTDAGFIASNGLFDNVVNNPADLGNHVGIDLPQFYLEGHFPVLTERGVDLRVGKFFTLHGNELTPAIQTNFYSHSYGYFYAWPFTHTGVMATVHVGDTVDIMNAIVRGWDQAFDDVNDAPAYHGMFIWTSCDKRQSFWVTWITGPEQADDTDHFRTLITYDYSHKFGTYDQWQYVLHGGNAWEAFGPNAANAEWYDYAFNLFYTVDPRLILGLRGEWFRDDDGARTGLANNYYEVTLGFTYKPYQNLRIRPELRFDWSDPLPAYNDGKDSNQQTLAMDVIWEF